MEGPQFSLFVILQTKSEVVKFEGPKLNLHQSSVTKIIISPKSGDGRWWQKYDITEGVALLIKTKGPSYCECMHKAKKKWYFLISLVVVLLTSKTHSSKPRQGIYKITAFGELERWLPIGTLHIFFFKPQRARHKYLL